MCLGADLRFAPGRLAAFLYGGYGRRADRRNAQGVSAEAVARMGEMCRRVLEYFETGGEWYEI